MIGRPGGLRPRQWLWLALATIATVLYVFNFQLDVKSPSGGAAEPPAHSQPWGAPDQAKPPPQREAPPQSRQDRQGWGPTVGFASAQRLDEHFDKHGAEFGRIAKQEYLRIAQELRDRPAGGAVLEAVRKDGVITRFDRERGIFLAFNANGVIRTCFKPDDGERYFRRQLERDR